MFFLCNTTLIMRQFTVEQRAFIVKTYIETHSSVEVKRLFAIEYPGTNPPVKSTIKWNYDKFVTHGTCWNRNEHNSGRLRTGRSQANIANVLLELQNNPKTMSCPVNNLNIPSATFNRIVQYDIKWHPYRIQRRHELLQGDADRRVRFANWFLARYRARQFITKSSAMRQRFI